MKIFLIIVILTKGIFSFCHETFGNNTVEIPMLGVLFLDNSPIKHKTPWGIERQYNVGIGYGHSIDNRKFFFQSEAKAAFGPVLHSSRLTLATFMAQAGIRYYILEETFKPFFDLKLSYLHFLGHATKYLNPKTDLPIWIGLVPSLGISWVFLSEMALSLSTSVGLYANVSEIFRHVIDINLSYVIYF